jgi:diguanylate cyclase (GGDEF)-like protein/PAS domain S-box-containing protein
MTAKILLLAGDLAIGSGVKKMVATRVKVPVAVKCATTLMEALQLLSSEPFDLLIADFELSDCQVLEGPDKVHALMPGLPVVAVRNVVDDDVAVEMRRHGVCEILRRSEIGEARLSAALAEILDAMSVKSERFLHRALSDIVFNSVTEAVISVDEAGRVARMNPTAERLTGWKLAQAAGAKITEVMPLLNAVTRRPDLHPLELILGLGETVRFPVGYVLLRRDGVELSIEDASAPIRDAGDNIRGAVVVFNQAEGDGGLASQLDHMAKHDALTGLPNRLLLGDRVAQAIKFAKRDGLSPAMLFIDLDNFKHINDSLGHAIGDMVLQSVARRLSECVRKSDTVCRQGGDEFVILLPHNMDASAAGVAAEKILAAVGAPHHVAGHELHVGASIGISLGPHDGGDQDMLLQNADVAMYQAKAGGKGGYQFFEPAMNARATERQLVESNLRMALAANQFVVHYQPKVRLSSGEVTGCEALLRWNHPEWGLVAPNRFIPVAEYFGLIVPIGEWTLREACLQGALWLAEGIEFGSVAVNISMLQFRAPGFVTLVKTILAETGLAASRLQLEITESFFARDIEHCKAILDELKTVGVALAIDDFGTGYSSLNYLHRFPIDVLKIDRSFIERMGTPGSDCAVAAAVIAIANSLGQQVVAEGIETREQVEVLEQLRCDEGQGFLYSPAVAPAQFAAFVLRH